MMAVHESSWKHKWVWHNAGYDWDKVATDWAGDEDWICKRARCQTLEDKKRFVTFALKSVNHSTTHRTRTGKKKKNEDKAPRTLGPAEKTIHIREEGPTVQLCGDSEAVSVLWGRNTDEELAKFKIHCTLGGKEKAHILSHRFTLLGECGCRRTKNNCCGQRQ